MLHWRLLVGVSLTIFVVGLCWLDAISPVPGLALMPFYLICVYFLCKELLQLLNAAGVYPRRTTVYLGVFGTILLCWFSCYNSLPIVARLEGAFATVLQDEAESSSDQEAKSAGADEREIGAAAKALEKAEQAVEAAKRAVDAARDRRQRSAAERVGVDLDAPIVDGESGNGDAVVPISVYNEKAWKTAAFAGLHILLAIAAGVLVAFVGEMARFKLPGGNLINLTGAVFAIAYLGLLGSFMVMLRIAYGIMAVLSMLVVAKLCDVGAYTVGRLAGRHKMAPSLSPGKTIESGIGGLLFAVFGAWFSCAFLFPLASGRPSETTWFGIVAYGVCVGLAGAIGDLAESFIKRDAMRKDSGANVPGFGGFLDLFDSLLIASPVAFGLWAFGAIR